MVDLKTSHRVLARGDYLKRVSQDMDASDGCAR